MDYLFRTIIIYAFYILSFLYIMNIIVARYNENVEWTKDFSNVIIYNKGELLNNGYNEILLNNVGREQHTFYKYIYDNYDNLENYTIFLQGNPFDHLVNTIEKLNEIINNKEYNKDFEILCHHIIPCNLSGCQYHANLPLNDVYEKLFNEKLLYDIFKNTGRDLRKIDEKRMEIEFIVALEECNNSCILYSKEYFSDKYSSNPYSHFNEYKSVDIKHFKKSRRRQEAESDIIRYGNDYKISVNPKRGSKMKLRSYVKVSGDNMFKPVLSNISDEIEDGTSDRYYKYPEIKDYICKLSDDILNETSLRKQKISKLKSKKRKRSYDGKRKLSKKRK